MTGSAPIAESADQSPDADRPIGFGPALLGMVGAFVIGTLVASIELTISGRDPSHITLLSVLLAYLGTWLGIVPAIAWAARSLRGLRTRLGLEFSLADIPVGIAAGVAGQLLLVVLIYLPVSWIWPDVYDRLGDPAEKLSALTTGWGAVAIFIAVCVIAPFVEELFFRGVVLRALRARWGTAAAVVSSSLLFGLLHFQPIQTPGLVAFGAVLAIIAIRTGRLGANIVAHMAFNATTMIILFLS